MHMQIWLVKRHQIESWSRSTEEDDRNTIVNKTHHFAKDIEASPDKTTEE